MQKKPRVGPMILMVAVGAGTVGFILGHFVSPAAPPARPSMDDREARAAAEFLWEEPTNPYEEDLDELTGVSAEATAAESEEEEALPPSALLDSLRKHADSPRSQQILIGMIADAARIGAPVLTDIKQMLDSGVDIKFKSFSGKPGEYPSLRTALLAAAEATGDPAAVEMIAEVAQTSESPVEVVFSAHLLDRLDSLDAPTAQRTLESLTGRLTAEERKAMGSIVQKVVPAAARADPAYAENFLLTQLHLPPDQRANPRYVIPALDGLSSERARDVVLTSITAGDVDEKAKRALAGRAAQRADLEMLSGLRGAIESNLVSPKISSSIAYSAMSGRGYGRMAKQARNAVRKGDLGRARQIAERFNSRLQEAGRTVDAARNAGAKLNKKVDTVAKLHHQTLGDIRASIRKRLDRDRKQQARQAKKN